MQKPVQDIAETPDQAQSRFGDTRMIGIAILCMTIAGISIGLTVPLLSLVLEARGIDFGWIGANAAFSALASIVGAPFAAPLSRRFGTVRVLSVSLLVCAVIMLTLPLMGFWAWFPLRFILVFGTTMVFVMGEYWINAAAHEARRGLMMGIYATALSLGFAAGPLILALVGSAGYLPFAIGAAVFAAAVIPLVIFTRNAPEPREQPSQALIGFLWVAPAATFAAFTFGASEQVAMSFLALYGLRSGLNEFDATMLVTMMMLGNVLLQIPIGMVADRMNRNVLLTFCGVVGVLGMMALPFVIHDKVIASIVILIWSGITCGLYTVGLTQLGSRFRGSDLASANAMFVMLYSVGMTIGPAATGASMEALGPNGFPAFLGTLFFAYALLAGWRIFART